MVVDLRTGRPIVHPGRGTKKLVRVVFVRPLWYSVPIRFRSSKLGGTMFTQRQMATSLMTGMMVALATAACVFTNTPVQTDTTAEGFAYVSLFAFFATFQTLLVCAHADLLRSRP